MGKLTSVMLYFQYTYHGKIPNAFYSILQAFCDLHGMYLQSNR